MLGKEDGLGWHGQVRFRRVIRIIEADGDEFLRIGDARTDAGITAHQRQRFRLDLGEARQALWADRIAADIGNDAR